MKHLLTIFGLTLSLSVQADTINETGKVQLSIEFGAPTLIHHLTYQKMYSEKPFEKAILYYYDNGLYKIISPGEEHYGVYIIQGETTDPTYTINYMSLPSSDWGDNVAKHDLVFHNDTLKFEQQALAHTDQNIPLQFGVFTTEKNTFSNPLPVKWSSAGN